MQARVFYLFVILLSLNGPSKALGSSSLFVSEDLSPSQIATLSHTTQQNLDQLSAVFEDISHRTNRIIFDWASNTRELLNGSDPNISRHRQHFDVMGELRNIKSYNRVTQELSSPLWQNSYKAPYFSGALSVQ